MRELAYDDERRPLCNVVAKCTAVAVEQSVEDCSGCEDVAAAHAGQLEAKRAEHVKYEQGLELVRQELARRAEAGEEARLSTVEEVAVRLGMDKVRELGEAIEALTVAHAATAVDHSHPVYACSKHTAKLPAPPEKA